MARLFLLRHAKSSWDEPVPDRLRPLAARGRRAAPAMAEYMRDEGLVPARVLCSPATRTRQTWALMAPILGDVPVSFPGSLYGADVAAILDVVRAEDGDSPILLLGHNPGLQEAALALSGPAEDGPWERMAAKYPTAALAVLDFEGEDWADVGVGTATLRRFVRPKDLAGARERGL